MKAILFGILLVISSYAFSQEMNFGHFEGKVKVEWLQGKSAERRMQLLEEFSYIDPKGKRWVAKKGYVTDGATIPKVFWSFVGGPFDGQYRDAAVIHDQYCDSKTEPSTDVHRIFYYANRASGVSELKSKILYAAVRIGGPKWGGKSNCYSSCHAITDSRYTPDASGRLVLNPNLSDTDAKTIVDWVTQKNPTLEEIDLYATGKFPQNEFGH